MPDFVRVRDTSTGHQLDVPARDSRIGESLTPLNDPKRWPDLTGRNARPRPPLHATEKDGAPAKAKTTTTKEA